MQKGAYWSFGEYPGGRARRAALAASVGDGGEPADAAGDGGLVEGGDALQVAAFQPLPDGEEGFAVFRPGFGGSGDRLFERGLLFAPRGEERVLLRRAPFVAGGDGAQLLREFVEPFDAFLQNGRKLRARAVEAGLPPAVGREKRPAGEGVPRVERVDFADVREARGDLARDVAATGRVCAVPGRGRRRG